MSGEPSPEQQADALMAAQWGAITFSQAMSCGLTVHQVKARLRSGRWLRAGLQTFVSPASTECWQRQLMAACLAGPYPTVASHGSAAALLGLLDPPAVPQVTVPRAASGRLARVEVHHRDLTDEERTLVGVIPSVTPVRMLGDCAELLRGRDLEDLVDDVFFQQLCTPAELDKAVAEWGTAGRRGVSELLKAREVWTPGPRPGSPAEMRLIRRLVAQGFAHPDRQINLYGAFGVFVARVDCGWRPQKVGLEYYGKRYHGPRHEASDRARIKRIREETGWDVKVVRSEDLRGEATALTRWLAPRLLGSARGGCAQVLL